MVVADGVQRKRKLWRFSSKAFAYIHIDICSSRIYCRQQHIRHLQSINIAKCSTITKSTIGAHQNAARNITTFASIIYISGFLRQGFIYERISRDTLARIGWREFHGEYQRSQVFHIMSCISQREKLKCVPTRAHSKISHFPCWQLDKTLGLLNWEIPWKKPKIGNPRKQTVRNL